MNRGRSGSSVRLLLHHFSAAQPTRNATWSGDQLRQLRRNEPPVQLRAPQHRLRTAAVAAAAAAAAAGQHQRGLTWRPRRQQRQQPQQWHQQAAWQPPPALAAAAGGSSSRKQHCRAQAACASVQPAELVATGTLRAHGSAHPRRTRSPPLPRSPPLHPPCRQGWQQEAGPQHRADTVSALQGCRARWGVLAGVWQHHPAGVWQGRPAGHTPLPNVRCTMPPRRRPTANRLPPPPPAATARYWLSVGAQPSETVGRLLGQAGVIPRPPPGLHHGAVKNPDKYAKK